MVWFRIALFVVAGLAVAQSTVPFRARTRPSPVPAGRRAYPTGEPIRIPTPLGLPPVPIPADNPPTAETVALGHKLFFDKLFSRDNTVSCASCHDPKAGGADPRQFSEGIRGLKGGRNAPATFNAAYNDTQFWDGRATSLEHQAEGPVTNPVEFAHSLSGVVRKLMGSPVYVRLFEKAWGPGPITYEMVGKSIASYERTLVSGNSPFDRYFYGGDTKAMSESAIRGLRLFLDPSLKAANCISCHRIDPHFATFAEERFHNTGVAWDPRRGILTDMGRWAIVQRIRWQGAFRTPTLRNIELTAPYMHNGSMKTLEEVVDFYFEGGRPNPWISNDMPDPGLPDIPKDQQPQAKRDIVEFMKHLNGEIPALAGPPE